MSRPDLSVLIPFYNEEGNVLPLLKEVHEALEGILVGRGFGWRHAVPSSR